MENQKLKSYAVTDENSKGRAIKEDDSKYRSEFQRDRDRIINSSYFRRLNGKTQVITNPDNDGYRTRLTHSLEVAQVSKTIGRFLGVNEDLCESLALAHDLGHTPFGHTGQDILNELMADYGGFEHNIQSLKIVDSLEKSYINFNGLNLMFETREGILKHCSVDNAIKLGDVASNRLNNTSHTIETQIVDISDAIAYNHHDLMDGFKAGYIKLSKLESIPLVAKHIKKLREEGVTDESLLVMELVRRVKGDFINNLIETTTNNIVANNIKTLEDVRGLKDSSGQAKRLVEFDAEHFKNHKLLKMFLKNEFYKNPEISETRDHLKKVIKFLFHSYMKNPEMILDSTRFKSAESNSSEKNYKYLLANDVADYIAGMTDKFAYKEYDKVLQNMLVAVNDNSKEIKVKVKNSV